MAPDLHRIAKESAGRHYNIVSEGERFPELISEIGRSLASQYFLTYTSPRPVEDGAEIRAFSHLEGAVVRSGARIGPHARLRPGAVIGPGARVGNFVEVKNAVLEEGAKANHLAYIGDASVGAGANVGAGAITCNYDGFRKHRTEIGAGAFIGSNSALVAPVSIGAGAVVGAGSTVSRDVEADALMVARAARTERKGWAARIRARRLLPLPEPRGAGAP